MKKHFFMSKVLCLLSLFSTGFIFSAGNLVHLIFSDGYSLGITQEKANNFGILRNILDDLPNENTIPIPYGDVGLMRTLIRLTTIPANQIREYLQNNSSLRIARLLQLADYLDLLDDAIKENVNKLRSLSTLLEEVLQEQIRVIIAPINKIESILVRQTLTRLRL